MITGKDIIMYILKNDLVDKEVISEKSVSDILATPEELASKFGTGVATVMAMYNMGMIKGYEIGEQVYFSRGLLTGEGLDLIEK